MSSHINFFDIRPLIRISHGSVEGVNGRPVRSITIDASGKNEENYTHISLFGDKEFIVQCDKPTSGVCDLCGKAIGGKNMIIYQDVRHCPDCFVKFVDMEDME